jgi:alanine-alpha-ketoisovalerate/valine-pyruvate aminotransferase
VELTGEVIVDQEVSLKSYEGEKNLRGKASMTLFRMILGFIFDDLYLALSMSRQLYSARQEGPSIIVPFSFFFQGLIASSWARKSKLARPSYLREGRAISFA